MNRLLDRLDVQLAELETHLATLRTQCDAELARLLSEKERLLRARKVLIDPVTTRVLQALADAGVEVKV